MRTLTYTKNLVFATAGPRERRAAGLTAVVCVVALIGVMPFARVSPGESHALLVATCTLYAGAATLTAWLLRGQYRVTHSLSVGVLAVMHAYAAALVVTYLIAFPNVFAPADGGVSLQAAAWLWIAGHAGLVGMALAYVGADRYGRGARSNRAVLLDVGGVAAGALTLGVVVAATLAHHALPIVMLSPHTFAPLFVERIVPALAIAYVGAIVAIIARTGLRSATSLWLAVIYVALLCEVLAGGFFAGARFTLAWYAGCFEASVASCSFLIVLLGRMNATLIAFAADNRSLAEKTLRDGLTDLLNRRGFDERLREAVRSARRDAAPTSLLMIDIDHFKTYNDYFGHVAGDDALRAIACTIASSVVRARDSSCRIGGEEFAVVLPATDETGALTVAYRIHRAVANLAIPQAPGSATPALTVSIGIATAVRENLTALRMLHSRADAALYDAKRRGRNTTRTATDLPTSSLTG